MSEDFFDIVDSHPMTDIEATERLKKCGPRLLPQFDQYERGMKGLVSADPQWLLDYEDYIRAWCSLAEDVGISKQIWTADKRKQLVWMEGYFESTAVNWLGG